MKAFLLLIIAFTMTTVDLHSQNYELVNVAQARELIKKNNNSDNFYIIDAREESQFLEGHIPGAINIDPRIPGAHEKLSQLDTSGEYLVYCRTRVRIFEIFRVMKNMGFQNIKLMIDGWLVWERAGYEVDMPGLDE